MDKLREHIQKNKEIFDELDVPAGHLKRFEEKLDSQLENKKAKFRFVIKSKYIAIASVAASLFMLVFIEVHNYQNKAVYTVDNFTITNKHYQEQMEVQIMDILCKLEKTNDEIKTELENDIQDIVEENIAFVEEIKKTTDEEFALEYLVRHYETNMQILEFINTRLGENSEC